MNQLDEILNRSEGWTIDNGRIVSINGSSLSDNFSFHYFNLIVAKMFCDNSQRHARAIIELSDDFILEIINENPNFSLLPIISMAKKLI